MLHTLNRHVIEHKEKNENKCKHFMCLWCKHFMCLYVGVTFY